MALPLLLPELLYNSNQRTRNLEQHQLDCKRVTEQLFRFKFFFSGRLYILQLSLRPMLPPTGPYIKSKSLCTNCFYFFTDVFYSKHEEDWNTASRLTHCRLDPLVFNSGFALARPETALQSFDLLGNSLPLGAHQLHHCGWAGGLLLLLLHFSDIWQETHGKKTRTKPKVSSRQGNMFF